MASVGTFVINEIQYKMLSHIQIFKLLSMQIWLKNVPEKREVIIQFRMEIGRNKREPDEIETH